MLIKIMGQTLNSDSKETPSCGTQNKKKDSKTQEEEEIKSATQENQEYVQICDEDSSENSSVSEKFQMYWKEAKEVWQSSKKMTFLDFFNTDCNPSDIGNDFIFPDTH